jgi:enterobactin synthetase component D
MPQYFSSKAFLASSVTSLRSPFMVKQLDLIGLPAGLDGYECTFDPTYYTDALFIEANLELPEQLQKVSTKRKAEFFAGRYCAQQLLWRHGHNSHVAIGNNRIPVWPTSVAASISHSRQKALCLIATQQALSVGVDIEHYLLPKQCESIGPSIVTLDELARLPSTLSYTQALTLCFSAKESAYKAIYPLTRRYVDFLRASITIDANSAQFSIVLDDELTTEIPYKLNGHFQLFADHLITYLSLFH